MGKNAIKILSDAKEHKRFKEGAFKQAKKFDISKILPKYISVYKKAIKGVI